MSIVVTRNVSALGRMPGLAGMVTVAVLWLLPLLAVASGAEEIELSLPDAHIGIASFRDGDADRPPILILHGFLQTKDFPTVFRLAEGLAGEGYSVLSPTFALGIDRRDRSLACEAIHTHDMQSDVEEIRAWVSWLRERTGKDPLLIGHSTASVQLLAYLTRYPADGVRAAILISLVPFGPGPTAQETPREADAARRAVDAGRTGPGNYALTYCRRYVTDARSYLSYYRWTRVATAEAIDRTKTPIFLIIGGDDKRIDASWLTMLERTKAGLIFIDEANHFFDHQHEFELLDSVLGVLSDLTD
jgi:alpha-beta hydrolase superfamily lysophospholipase